MKNCKNAWFIQIELFKGCKQEIFAVYDRAIQEGHSCFYRYFFEPCIGLLGYKIGRNLQIAILLISSIEIASAYKQTYSGLIALDPFDIIANLDFEVVRKRIFLDTKNFLCSFFR